MDVATTNCPFKYIKCFMSVTKARSGGGGVRHREQSFHCRRIYSAGSRQHTGTMTNKQLSPPKPGKITNSKNTYKQNKNLPLTQE